MLAGAAITLMLQSSATATAITMVLVAQGYIPFTMATAMVLGSNLGTTVTSNIAASVANVSAKRTARAHSCSTCSASSSPWSFSGRSWPWWG